MINIKFKTKLIILGFFIFAGYFLFVEAASKTNTLAVNYMGASYSVDSSGKVTTVSGQTIGNLNTSTGVFTDSSGVSANIAAAKGLTAISYTAGGSSVKTTMDATHGWDYQYAMHTAGTSYAQAYENNDTVKMKAAVSQANQFLSDTTKNNAVVQNIITVVPTVSNTYAIGCANYQGTIVGLKSISSGCVGSNCGGGGVVGGSNDLDTTILKDPNDSVYNSNSNYYGNNNDPQVGTSVDPSVVIPLDSNNPALNNCVADYNSVCFSPKNSCFRNQKGAINCNGICSVLAAPPVTICDSPKIGSFETSDGTDWVVKGKTKTLVWSGVTNVTFCEIVGPNSQTLKTMVYVEEISLGNATVSGSIETPTIIHESEFILTCRNGDGVDAYPNSVNRVIKLVPIYQNI